MRIKSLQVKPFAGLTDKKIEFSPGLNVILGPNEAGKSTLLNALKSVLFTEVNLTKTRYERLIKEYMPALGGNTIRVFLQFQIDGKDYWLEKTWKAGGKDGSCLFRFDDGREFTGDREVSRLIKQFIPAQEGTIRNILLTWQSALSRTIQVLDDEGKEVRSDLGTILRSSIMETDGISVDRLKEKLDREYKEHFQHWDREKGEPENGRGIHNPYLREVGKILYAYYEKENRKENFKEASEIEKEIDALNQVIQEKEAEQNRIREELTRYEPVKSQLIERQQIEGELSQVKGMIEEIKTINKEWLIKENWLLNLAGLEIEKIENKKKELNEEEAIARQNEQNKAFRIQFKRIEQLHNQTEEARKNLSGVKKVPAESIEFLDKKRQAMQNIDHRIMASRLRLSLISKIQQDITLRDATGKKEMFSLSKEEKIEKTFQGKLYLEHRDWVLEVQTGEGEIDELVNQREEIKKEFENELHRIGVPSFEEAQSIHKEYEPLKNELERIERNYQEEIKDNNYENLEEKYRQLGEERPARTLEKIVAEKVLLDVKLDNLKKEKQDTERQIKEWEKLFENHDNLVSKLGTNQVQLQELNKKLNSLPMLPDGFDDYKQFFDYLDSLNVSARKNQDEISTLHVQKAQKESEKPEQSSEELKVMAGEAEQNFQRVCLEGKAIAMIRSRADELLAKMGMNTYGEFQERFKKYFLTMCGNSFSGIEMDNDYPKKLIKSNGSELTYDLLSFGTKDTFSLALRLTMAEYFLGEKDGFLILDDALVDMDLARQRLAVAQIHQFAQTKQVIFLTCHSHTAKLLKGNSIEL